MILLVLIIDTFGFRIEFKNKSHIDRREYMSLRIFSKSKSIISIQTTIKFSFKHLVG